MQQGMSMMTLVASQTMVEYFGPWFRDFARGVKSAVGGATRFAQDRPLVAVVIVLLILLLLRTTRSST